MTSDDLVDLLLRVYCSDSVNPQQCAQALVQKLLMQNNKEDEDEKDELRGNVRMYI